MSFSIQEGCFRIEVKSNKVKRFEERADAAASRLIEFLQQWIEGKEDGQENPMYQLAMTLLESATSTAISTTSPSRSSTSWREQFGDAEYTAIMNLFKESHPGRRNRHQLLFLRERQDGRMEEAGTVVQPTLRRVKSATLTLDRINLPMAKLDSGLLPDEVPPADQVALQEPPLASTGRHSRWTTSCWSISRNQKNQIYF